VVLADQIGREFNVSDQGIEMEIEFTDDAHEAMSAKLYLQLKSGDSYLRERKGDGAEIFTIKDDRHARRTGVAPVSDFRLSPPGAGHCGYRLSC
jgi:hypothetical protein